MLFLIIQSLYFLHSLWSINQNFKNENVEYEIFIFLLDTYLAVIYYVMYIDIEMMFRSINQSLMFILVLSL